ncbi:MAG: hypothetical protein RL199_976 [Pseudomonadota bacterium]|jgi:hypothetical protein
MAVDHWTAFLGARRLTTGTLSDVLRSAWPHREAAGLLIFEHSSGRQTDFDWRGTPDEVVARAVPMAAPASGPGRPRLGVVAGEVTLLPRHWGWLQAQPGRASATLRRLVEEAMVREADDPRHRRDALGRVLWAVAGNAPEFEEASRALFAGDQERLIELSRHWPGDLPAFVREWVSG